MTLRRILLISALVSLVVIVFGVTFASADVWVNGYYRSNGAYVKGHYRSSPDGNPYNNYSFPGNTNPYTGKIAPGNPDTYLDNYYNRSGGSSGGSFYYSIPTPKPTPSCPLFSTYNFLEGTCKCNSGYVSNGSSCVSGSSYCWSKYGIFSSYDSFDKTCECDYGYELRSGTCSRIQKTNLYDYSGSLDSYTSTYTPIPTPTPFSCPLNSSLMDGECKCNPGYSVGSDKKLCVTLNQACLETFGPHTYGAGTSCYCESGYSWNSSQTFCVQNIVIQTPTPTPIKTVLSSPTTQKKIVASPEKTPELAKTINSAKQTSIDFSLSGGQRIRECGSKDCKITFSVKPQDQLKLLSLEGNWYRVFATRGDSSVEGWISASLISSDLQADFLIRSMTTPVPSPAPTSQKRPWYKFW